MGSGQSTASGSDSSGSSGSSSFSDSINGVSYTPNSSPGSKKALIIGINYTGTDSQLNGCINDAHTARDYFSNLGFNCDVLTDNTATKPTKSNILSKLSTLFTSLHSGDTVVIYYSGHGSTVTDLSGDEIREPNRVYGDDSVIVPLDWETQDFIIDDTIRTYLVQAPTGSNVFCVFDSCNSGSVCDLRHNLFDTSYKSNPGDKSSDWIIRNKVVSNTNYAETNANVVSLSGSKDDQLSAEIHVNGVATGALTYAIFKYLRENTPAKTLEAFVQGVRANLSNFGLSQNPSLMSGRTIDTNTLLSTYINV